MDARLIIDAPASGPWNMAVDEALLLTADASGETVLRLYQWSEPTLSLGYFQKAADRARHPASQPLALVRRATGGGAIVHDHELTYSLATRFPGQQPGQASQLVQLAHQAIVDVLCAWGLPARRWSGTPHASEKPRSPGTVRDGEADEPFLCFQRRADEDVVLGDSKVAGSAQRRRRKGVLQHGSILMRRSEFAPELPGILDLLATPAGEDTRGIVRPEQNAAIQRFVTLWTGHLARAGTWQWRLDTLSSAERVAAENAVREKFSAGSWNEKR